jgi:hypothetical protein
MFLFQEGEISTTPLKTASAHPHPDLWNPNNVTHLSDPMATSTPLQDLTDSYDTPKLRTSTLQAPVSPHNYIRIHGRDHQSPKLDKSELKTAYQIRRHTMKETGLISNA